MPTAPNNMPKEGRSSAQPAADPIGMTVEGSRPSVSEPTSAAVARVPTDNALSGFARALARAAAAHDWARAVATLNSRNTQQSGKEGS